jgi:hypothetical protein
MEKTTAMSLVGVMFRRHRVINRDTYCPLEVKYNLGRPRYKGWNSIASWGKDQLGLAAEV